MPPPQADKERLGLVPLSVDNRDAGATRNFVRSNGQNLALTVLYVPYSTEHSILTRAPPAGGQGAAGAVPLSVDAKNAGVDITP